MTVVVDANILVASNPRDSRSRGARERIDHWAAQGEDLHAPQLFVYELASAMAWNQTSEDDAAAIWATVDDLNVSYHPPSHGMSLVAIAHRMRRRSAYDAAYIDLALLLNAELWTLDGKLARNAEAIGFPVRLVL